MNIIAKISALQIVEKCVIVMCTSATCRAHAADLREVAKASTANRLSRPDVSDVVS